MSTTRRVLTLLVAGALLAAACGSDDADTTVPTTTPDGTGTAAPTTAAPLDYDPNAEFIRADIDRATTTDVTAEELAQLVAGEDAFAFDLFLAAAGDGNLILSPYSVSTALTMTLAGARGTTAEEMQTALHLALIEERIHAARNELDLQLNAEYEPPFEEDEREPFTIRTANSIWGQPGYPFLDAFLELLARDYDAGMRLADFASDPEAARVAINDWVEEKTEGRIVDLIPQGAIDPLVRLVLVNAIWFKANWDEPFDAEMTRDAPFTLLDGSTVDVPMMQGPDRRLAYADAGDFIAVSIPYTGDASILVIMPAEGSFRDVVSSLTAEGLSDIDATLEFRQVNLVLPGFETRSELNLNELLIGLGIREAFQPPVGETGADFTGITEFRELYISDVVHQAFIKVDETGTEAAAATAVIMRATSAPIDEPLDVRIDHPFVYLIRHDSTGEILFMGQVTNPAET